MENSNLQLLPSEGAKELTTQVENFIVQWAKWKAIATDLVKSGFLPPIYKNPEQAMAVMLKARELNIPPMEAFQSLFPLNGKIGMQGNLMLALVRRSGKLEKLKITNSDGACEILVQRKTEEPYITKWTIADATRAGLIGKDNWKHYPRTMLMWRALAENFRVTFPDIISGMYLIEELDPNLQVEEDGNYNTSFDESATYRRIQDSLMKLCDMKTSTLTDFQQWVELNKNDIAQLTEKHREILKRIYKVEFKRREPKPEEVKNGVNGNSAESDSETKTPPRVEQPPIEQPIGDNSSVPRLPTPGPSENSGGASEPQPSQPNS